MKNDSEKEEASQVQPASEEMSVDKNEMHSMSAKTISWMGFELFDLIMLSVQTVAIVFAAQTLVIYENPYLRLVAGIGFLVAVFYLSRTREYSVGVKELSKRYDIFWFLAVGGGAILGAIFVTVFIFGSLKTILDSFGVEASGEWLKTPGVLAAIASLGFLPYLASRAESKKLDDEDAFQDYPVWAHYLGRGTILLAANLVLTYLFLAFRTEGNDLIMNLIGAAAMMAMFYIPIRMQEMMLNPNGPHLQSLGQTLIALTCCNLSIPFFT